MVVLLLLVVLVAVIVKVQMGDNGPPELHWLTVTFPGV